MGVLPNQCDGAVLSDRLRSRISELAVTLLCIEQDGHAALVLGGDSFVQRVMNLPSFSDSVRKTWPRLLESSHRSFELWPDVHLAPLPWPTEHHSDESQMCNQRLAALFVGSMAIESVPSVIFPGEANPNPLVDGIEINRLCTAMTWMIRDGLEIDQARSDLLELSEELVKSYEELYFLYQLSANMTVDQSPEILLAQACDRLREVSGFRGLAIQLNETEKRLDGLSQRTFASGSFDRADAPVADICRSLVRDASAGANPWIIDDTSEVNIPALASLDSTALVVRLCVEKNYLGMMIGGSKLDGNQISSVDSKLFKSLADNLSVFLENLMLYDDMQSMFLGTLHALTSAIDAKDSYTRGHSERVALMSRLIAHAAGLDDAQSERHYLAGLVHDVGKIGVPEIVLQKPGRLTIEEFGQIKRHPEIGARILKDIRQMADLIPGVLHHHERWGGGGYPHGLSGNQIPLIGRIIGLADAFDAMSSDRTYRRRMSPVEVLAEVERCSGTQFDPVLCRCMRDIDLTPFVTLSRKHREAEEYGMSRAG